MVFKQVVDSMSQANRCDGRPDHYACRPVNLEEPPPHCSRGLEQPTLGVTKKTRILTSWRIIYTSPQTRSTREG